MSENRTAYVVSAFTKNGTGGNKAGIAAVCRNFAPLYGIDEESATGTSNCALACYLFRYVMQRRDYRFAQGRTMGAESEILVHLDTYGDSITGVFVGGKGVVEKEVTV